MGSSSARKYDVFLSFRGEDTRSNFTSHLRNALSHKSIRIFVDDKLKRGEDVWKALAKAIEDSNVSIVVFSENYASSKWCLEELVKILECRKKLGQVVIPVFYEVDPSDIRNQTGNYEKVFAKHERDPGDEGVESNKEKVLRWKTALTEAANISGWDSRIHRDESHVIENVVNDVLQKLHQLYPTELKGFVKTQENCTNVELLLKKFRVIGIWGMGGIGKSTIAKILFAKLFPQYDHVCFVANAKEYSLDKLFSVLLKEEVYTSNVVGSTFDMRRLSSKKVFIVLDDVDKDSLDPFEYLYREFDLLHLDSRLIITTRDKHLLEGKVDEVYKVMKWKNQESLELFCKEAFNKSCAPKGYERLSERAVKYAGGIPLALKVLGSYFHSKKIKFWKSTFRKLKEYPNEKIQNVLKVSYNGLDDLERKIFLDIAYFFKGKKKDHVTRILDACGFEATSGIENLEDKALITISNSDIILMHDLLKKMALEIVRQECSGDREKRSRLKDNEAREVIEENKGTGVIEGIALDLSEINGLRLCADTFTKMKTLRILKFYNTLGQSSSNTYLDLPETLEPFSDKLRYIEWIGYPFESLPSPFCAKFLVEIHMPHSKVKELWQGIQELNSLERIELSGCQQFEKLPDLSKAPRLKSVNLSCCESLRYLHPSILSSDTLVTLILDGCTNLKRVKGEKHLKSLEKISVNGCLSLEEFAVSSDLIENLDLSNTGIQTLDTSIGRMLNLKWLNLEGLRLGHPLKELSCLTSLKELKLSDSGLAIDKQQLLVLFDGLRSLLKLHMKDMSNLFELPGNISVLSQLQELRLDGSNVKRLPESIQNLKKLEILSLENCKELLCLPKLPSLIKYLGAINCVSLVSVSNLHTLATGMFGMTKFITFKNSLKLDGHSCKLIMESLQLTMMHAVFDNVRSRYYDTHGYNYTSVGLCLPGSRVPRKITYRTTESSITIELSQSSDLLGFIFSVVLSPAGGMKKHGSKIKSKCYWPGKVMKEAWLYSDIGGLNSDHVYVWYDPFHCDNILNYFEQKVCFHFYVANDEGEIDGSICIKECGIHLVRVLEVPSVLKELDWDLIKKQNFVVSVEYATDQKINFNSIEQFDEEESNDMRNQIENQQQDLIEHSSSDSIVGSESTTEMVETDSAEEGDERKNHYLDVEESLNSTHRETKSDSGTDCRQNNRESTNAVKYEGNKGMPIKPDATLHIESELDKENESKEKSNEENPMKKTSRKRKTSSTMEAKSTKKSISRKKITAVTKQPKNVEKRLRPESTSGDSSEKIVVDKAKVVSIAKGKQKVTKEPRTQNHQDKKPKLMALTIAAGQKEDLDVQAVSSSFEAIVSKDKTDKENVEPEIALEVSSTLEKLASLEPGLGAPITITLERQSGVQPTNDGSSSSSSEQLRLPSPQMPNREDSSSSKNSGSSAKDDEEVEVSSNKEKEAEQEKSNSSAYKNNEENVSNAQEQENNHIGEENEDKDDSEDESNRKKKDSKEDEEIENEDDEFNEDLKHFDLLSEWTQGPSSTSKPSEPSTDKPDKSIECEKARTRFYSLAFDEDLTISLSKLNMKQDIYKAAEELKSFDNLVSEKEKVYIQDFLNIFDEAYQKENKQRKHKAMIEEIDNGSLDELNKLQFEKDQVQNLQASLNESKSSLSKLEESEKELEAKLQSIQQELKQVKKQRADLSTTRAEIRQKIKESFASAKAISTSLRPKLDKKHTLELDQMKLVKDLEDLVEKQKKLKLAYLM